jgi:benzil reductase ((S)-benzoin forming)
MNTEPRHLTLLTGGSRGMGRAMARQLLDPQRLLLCIARHTDDDLTHAAMAQGTHLEQWAQDLSDTTETAERLARWLDSLHPPSLLSATLINNAGMIPTIGPLDSCPLSEMQQALRVGLEAPMALTGVFLHITQGWVDKGWSGPRKVLNISSGLGQRAMASQGPYCAAKAGMDHFSRCVALEQARQPSGARIVSLAPGVIDTDMQTQLRAGNPEAFPDVDRFRAMKAGGMLTSAEDAARQVLGFLNRPDFGAQPVADVRD